MKKVNATGASEAVKNFLVAARAHLVDRIGAKKAKTLFFAVPVALVAFVLLLVALLLVRGVSDGA